MTRSQIHFVTGRLAAPALQRTLLDLGPRAGFDYSISVLPITVAALMTPQWIQRHLQVPANVTEILLPGYCNGDLQVLTTAAGCPVRCGPRDLRELPEFFGRQPKLDPSYGEYDIQILAEINHAPRLAQSTILKQAEQLSAAGADVIDVGCDPGDRWNGVGDCVKALQDQGHRVSIDSLNPKEIQDAVQAGAELVLSVNSTNRDAAPDWGCEVVAIPDEPTDLRGLYGTVEQLTDANVALRIDPVLEPIGYGLAKSLHRYLQVRSDFPDQEMMMGIGNLTELTDVDSAGINVLLLGICQELKIHSVLTTQVINWARSSVRECDLARRLVRYAIHHQVLPKHLEPGLVMLRDGKQYALDERELEELAAQVRDHNYRLFADDRQLHLVSSGLYLKDTDPFHLFDQLLAAEPRNLDASHAFYLGYELAKAKTAITLGKQYEQDEPLDWGLLTVNETCHRLPRTGSTQSPPSQPGPGDSTTAKRPSQIPQEDALE